MFTGLQDLGLSSDNNIVSLLLSIVSILMSFILGIATYISWNGIPQLHGVDLKAKVIGRNIKDDLSSLLKKKERLAQKMIILYIISILSIVAPIFAYYFSPDIYFRYFFWIWFIVIIFLFIFLVCKISAIIKLSLCIDKQLLSLWD